MPRHCTQLQPHRRQVQQPVKACACCAHRVTQTLMPACDRVWTYRAGSRAPPTGHPRIHQMKLTRLHLVHPPQSSRQPIPSATLGNVSGLPAIAQSSLCSNGRSVEARRTIGRRMPPESDPWMRVLHNLARQADSVARDPKSMARTFASRHRTKRPTRDVQGARRSPIDTSPRRRM